MNDSGEFPALPSSGEPTRAHTNQSYELLEVILQNGLSAVHRARDTLLNREVAIKALQHTSPGPELEARLLREARLLARLAHPGIPPVYGFATIANALPCIVMKMIWGQMLGSYLRGDRSSDGDQSGAVDVLEQVAHTVAFAHTHGVIHCDLKPGNIVIDPLGEVYVTEWLLAIVRDGHGTPDGHEPQAGQVMGTPAYMAPEQARGEWDTVDARTDVYGLGSILCTMLTGAPLRTETILAELLERARDGDTTGAFSRLDACGGAPELIALAKWCLAPLRENRPPDAATVAAALAACTSKSQ